MVTVVVVVRLCTSEGGEGRGGEGRVGMNEIDRGDKFYTIENRATTNSQV